MAFDIKIKEAALKMMEQGELDPSVIKASLASEYGFNGTLEIVKYWIKNREYVQGRIAEKVEELTQLKTMEFGDDLIDVENLNEDLETVISGQDIEDYDPDTIEHLQKQIVKLNRSRQNLMDVNRTLRAASRTEDRVINATRALLQHVLRNIPDRLPVNVNVVNLPEGDIKSTVGVVQISDWHLNEIVLAKDTKGKNTYSFAEASARLQKFAAQVRRQAQAFGITNLIVAYTGDNYNSTRRKDEVLRQASTLSIGFLIGVDIFASFLQDLSQDFNIEVISVLGNESRLDDDISSVDFANNLDYLLHHSLAKHMQSQKNIIFHDITTDHEMLVNVNGANILFIHGHNRIKPADLVMKYTKLGVIIHYMISGHYHNTQLTQTHGQSGGAVGDNAYNFFRLNKVSRSSQNFYIVDNEEGEDIPVITPIPIDLQNTTGYMGYAVPEDHEQFGYRTATKAGNKKTILQVVI